MLLQISTNTCPRKLTLCELILWVTPFNLNINLEYGNFVKKSAADLNIFLYHMEYGRKRKNIKTSLQENKTSSSSVKTFPVGGFKNYHTYKVSNKCIQSNACDAVFDFALGNSFWTTSIRKSQFFIQF